MKNVKVKFSTEIISEINVDISDYLVSHDFILHNFIIPLDFADIVNNACNDYDGIRKIISIDNVDTDKPSAIDAEKFRLFSESRAYIDCDFGDRLFSVHAINLGCLGIDEIDQNQGFFFDQGYFIVKYNGFYTVETNDYNIKQFDTLHDAELFLFSRAKSFLPIPEKFKYDIPAEYESFFYDGINNFANLPNDSLCGKSCTKLIDAGKIIYDLEGFIHAEKLESHNVHDSIWTAIAENCDRIINS